MLADKASNSFWSVIWAGLLIAIISLLWSFFGLLAPISSKFGEYTSSAIAQEVAGHVIFGLIVGAFSLDISLALVCGAAAILIDLDHTLSAIGLPALARTTHSAIFALVAALAVAYLAKGNWKRPALAVTVVGSVLSHLSYDAFSGDGVFPLLAPISYNLYSFPSWSWVSFETSGIILVSAVTITLRRHLSIQTRIGGFAAYD